MNSCAKNGGAPRRRFPAIDEKPEGGGVQTPPRPGAGYRVKRQGGFRWQCKWENMLLQTARDDQTLQCERA